MYLRYTDALQEVHSRTKPILHATRKQPRASIDNAFDVRTVDSSLTKEERKHRNDVRNARGENLRAHTNDSAELNGGEIHRRHEIDCGSDVGKRGSSDGRMVFNDRKEIDADGVEEEHFLLKLGARAAVGRRRRERRRERGNVRGARGKFRGQNEGDFGIDCGELEGSGAGKRGEKRGRRRVVEESAIGEEVESSVLHGVHGELH